MRRDCLPSDREGFGQTTIGAHPAKGTGFIAVLEMFLADKATFVIPAVQACITATPRGYESVFPQPGGTAFIEALDGTGAVIGRTESTTERVPQQLCVSTNGIAAVRFAGTDSAYAIFDNLRWTRVLPENQ